LVASVKGNNNLKPCLRPTFILVSDWGFDKSTIHVEGRRLNHSTIHVQNPSYWKLVDFKIVASLLTSYNKLVILSTCSKLVVIKLVTTYWFADM
jgi:hypothetical protein